MNEKIYQIATTLLGKINCAQVKKLVEFAGSAEAVFHLSEKALQELCPENSTLATELVTAFPMALEKAKKEWEFTQKFHIQTLFYQDPLFPHRLLDCEDGPSLLFYKGNVNLNKTKCLAIVGTRHATEYGKQACEKIVQDLAHLNLLIISGLAHGIDGVAHQAALNTGLSTVGVMASGMNQIYPAAHRKLAKDMVQQGGLITEFVTNTFPAPYQFIRRNRIIAGMADAVLVVESAAKGGSLVTADLANSYFRDVFALPGKINDPYSIGCNQLIKYNKAVLVENAQDICKAMNWDLPSPGKSKDLWADLSEKEEWILQLLIHFHKMHINALSQALECSIEETKTILFGLEMNNYVRCLPGEMYERV